MDLGILEDRLAQEKCFKTMAVTRKKILGIPESRFGTGARAVEAGISNIREQRLDDLLKLALRCPDLASFHKEAPVLSEYRAGTFCFSGRPVAKTRLSAPVAVMVCRKPRSPAHCVKRERRVMDLPATFQPSYTNSTMARTGAAEITRQLLLSTSATLITFPSTQAPTAPMPRASPIS